MFTLFVVVGSGVAFLVGFRLTIEGLHAKQWLHDRGVIEAPGVKTAAEAREIARARVHDETVCVLASPCRSYEKDATTAIDAAVRCGGSRYDVRYPLVDYYGWAIPNTEALDAIQAYSPLIEMGAGRGYWTKLLPERGADVLAFDNWARPYRDRTWTTILQGSPRQIPKHDGRTLLMVWPELGHEQKEWDDDCNAIIRRRDVGNVMWKSITKYRGDTVILVSEGCYGCCGTEAAFQLLSQRGFKEVDRVDIPQWDGIHDDLQIWRRNAAASRRAA